jgi:hypothetical protein
MEVSEATTAPPVSVAPDASLAEATGMMSRSAVGSLGWGVAENQARPAEEDVGGQAVGRRAAGRSRTDGLGVDHG